MKKELVNEICTIMDHYLSKDQNQILEHTLNAVFEKARIPEPTQEETMQMFQEQNTKLINLFLAAKKIEGCSDNTLKYYRNTLNHMVNHLQKSIPNMETNDLRLYLSTYQKTHNSSKVTLDKFHRTMATMAIDKGMPIEQVQRLLGHSQIDTTLHYAIVNQANVKNSHRKYVY